MHIILFCYIPYNTVDLPRLDAYSKHPLWGKCWIYTKRKKVERPRVAPRTCGGNKAYINWLLACSAGKLYSHRSLWLSLHQTDRGANDLIPTIQYIVLKKKKHLTNILIFADVRTYVYLKKYFAKVCVDFLSLLLLKLSLLTINTC